MELLKKSYLIIGGGRLASQFGSVFQENDISFYQWTRAQKFQELKKYAMLVETILLCVSDDAIEELSETLRSLTPDLNKKLCHFSGAKSVDGVYGFHPLASFTLDSMAPEEFGQVPFVGSHNEECFRSTLPELKNQYFQIPETQKEFYHALLVTSGNFSTLLWQKAGKELAEKCGLPLDVLHIYQRSILSNLQKDLKGALTGPLARGDMQTVARNQEALKHSGLSELYGQFVETYSKGGFT